ncbi:MAG: MgtC/SapB family protein [Bacilli bacterium]|nr:MgtC/SapB family protein [Bacilli bacterium]
MFTTIDQKIAEIFNSWQINGWPIGNFVLTIISLFLALLLCGAIGLEREIRGRSAGLRTHLLVGMGSCIVMVISIYGFPNQEGVTRDVARLAAQVISGVGFLGAGAIIYRNAGTKGLTTAGTIWLSMAIGLACGSMNFILAISATVIVMGVLLGLRKFEQRLALRNPTLVLIGPSNVPMVSKILEICEKYECIASNLFTEKVVDAGEDQVQITFRALAKKGTFKYAEFLEEMRQESGAYRVQVLYHH